MVLASSSISTTRLRVLHRPSSLEDAGLAGLAAVSNAAASSGGIGIMCGQPYRSQKNFSISRCENSAIVRHSFTRPSASGGGVSGRVRPQPARAPIARTEPIRAKFHDENRIFFAGNEHEWAADGAKRHLS